MPAPSTKPRTARAPKRAAAAPTTPGVPRPDYQLTDPDTRAYIGDCRVLLPTIPEVQRQQVDLVFADPPFNWNRDYDRWKAEASSGRYRTWHDAMPREDYLEFTFGWINACLAGLSERGSIFINIPDDTAAEIACFLKGHMGVKPVRPMHMVNWCVWHYRFGQNRKSAFINSKVHGLYFCVNPEQRVWHPEAVLEPSDRATTYFDPRTQSKKDGMPPGMRVPMDVWYGPYWGRIQGNNAERRGNHDNQLPEVYLHRVLACASEPGMLVLDPFLGSGTTGVVARAMGRRFIGTEFSAANAASAWERIERGVARPLSTYQGLVTAIHAPRRKSSRISRGSKLTEHD